MKKAFIKICTLAVMFCMVCGNMSFATKAETSPIGTDWESTWGTWTYTYGVFANIDSTNNFNGLGINAMRFMADTDISALDLTCKIYMPTAAELTAFGGSDMWGNITILADAGSETFFKPSVKLEWGAAGVKMNSNWIATPVGGSWASDGKWHEVHLTLSGSTITAEVYGLTSTQSFVLNVNLSTYTGKALRIGCSNKFKASVKDLAFTADETEYSYVYTQPPVNPPAVIAEDWESTWGTWNYTDANGVFANIDSTNNFNGFGINAMRFMADTDISALDLTCKIYMPTDEELTAFGGSDMWGNITILADAGLETFFKPSVMLEWGAAGVKMNGNWIASPNGGSWASDGKWHDLHLTLNGSAVTAEVYGLTSKQSFTLNVNLSTYTGKALRIGCSNKFKASVKDLAFTADETEYSYAADEPVDPVIPPAILAGDWESTWGTWSYTDGVFANIDSTNNFGGYGINAVRFMKDTEINALDLTCKIYMPTAAELAAFGGSDMWGNITIQADAGLETFFKPSVMLEWGTAGVKMNGNWIATPVGGSWASDGKWHDLHLTLSGSAVTAEVYGLTSKQSFTLNVDLSTYTGKALRIGCNNKFKASVKNIAFIADGTSYSYLSSSQNTDTADTIPKSGVIGTDWQSTWGTWSYTDGVFANIDSNNNFGGFGINAIRFMKDTDISALDLTCKIYMPTAAELAAFGGADMWGNISILADAGTDTFHKPSVKLEWGSAGVKMNGNWIATPNGGSWASDGKWHEVHLTLSGSSVKAEVYGINSKLSYTLKVDLSSYTGKALRIGCSNKFKASVKDLKFTADGVLYDYTATKTAVPNTGDRTGESIFAVLLVSLLAAALIHQRKKTALIWQKRF